MFSEDLITRPGDGYVVLELVPARISRLRLARNATRSAIRPSASRSGSARPQAVQAEA